MLPRRHLHTLKIERVLLATLQIVHVKSGDDLLPLDHIAGVDRSLQCARFQANRRCFGVLGIRSAGTARKTSRRANQADGCHHEVATIEALFLFVWHGELSSTLFACTCFAVSMRLSPSQHSRLTSTTTAMVSATGISCSVD